MTRARASGGASMSPRIGRPSSDAISNFIDTDPSPSTRLRGCEEIQSGPRCGRDEASREARRRGDAGTSRRRRNEADGLVPPATVRAGGGCGAICASLVVNDVITSPPPRSSISPRKLHQRGPLWISSQPLRADKAPFMYWVPEPFTVHLPTVLIHGRAWRVS